MSNKQQIQFAWWKLACEKNPDPVAFVGLDNRFIFANHAWCKLLGYSESELKEKTWQDITKQEDIGSDQAEVDSVIRGEKEEYYLEKTYIKKDRSHINIKLYVHRYPETSYHEGYVVFAKRITSEDYEDLKSKFLDLQKTVIILQQNSIASDFISSQISILEQKLEQNKEISKMLIEKADHNSINIGDKFGDNSNKAGRDNLINSHNGNIIGLIILFGFIIFLFLFLIGFMIFIINKPLVIGALISTMNSSFLIRNQHLLFLD
jgi:PAS domain S-box-containing protein